MAAEIPNPTARVVETLTREFQDQAPSLPSLLELLEAGVPPAFIARYRKERTGGLSERLIRDVAKRRRELLKLERRRAKVLEGVDAEGPAGADLRRRIERARTLPGLEEVLAPAPEKPRAEEDDRLAPLASAIETAETPLPLEELAAPFVSPELGVPDAKAAVGAAVEIIARRMAGRPEGQKRLRSLLLSSGKLVAKKAAEDVPGKYENYQDFAQPLRSVPSHRILAILRGAREKALDVKIGAEREKTLDTVRGCLLPGEDHPYRELLGTVVEEVHDRFLRPAADEEVFATLRKRADAEAVKIFAKNLEQLLMAPPAGRVVVMGVEPGVRRGCKIAVVDADGRHVGHASIYPFPPREKRDAARKTVGDFCRHHNVELIALGSGPGCREVERFLREVLKGDEGLTAQLTVVNEAGSAAFAVSAAAKREFPKLDPRVRAAVTIARRLQDPLAELVKIEARSIGVGPYQRDVDQALLSDVLGEVIEQCVARVGVDLNTAGDRLLARVAGLGPAQAKAIVLRRKEKGPFAAIEELREVLDEKSYLLSAGFLRVKDGANPLDRTAIHPESYEIVEAMADKLGVEPGDLLGNESALSGLDPAGFVTDRAGLPTILDVFAELKRGGADPRGTFELPSFREDVSTLADLEQGMELEGVVTNLASFGAFVDVGVDQEGLVHVSELSDDFVDDPGGVVAVGRRVKVRVIGVDRERKRLSLSMRTPGAKKPRRGERPRRPKAGGRKSDGQREAARGDRRPGGKKGGKKRDRPGRKPRREEDRPVDRAPRVIEQKGRREPEPEIDPDLPEEEIYRLKLERLRKKFQSGGG